MRGAEAAYAALLPAVGRRHEVTAAGEGQGAGGEGGTRRCRLARCRAELARQPADLGCASGRPAGRPPALARPQRFPLRPPPDLAASRGRPAGRCRGFAPRRASSRRRLASLRGRGASSRGRGARLAAQGMGFVGGEGSFTGRGARLGGAHIASRHGPRACFWSCRAAQGSSGPSSVSSGPGASMLTSSITSWLPLFLRWASPRLISQSRRLIATRAISAHSLYHSLRFHGEAVTAGGVVAPQLPRRYSLAPVGRRNEWSELRRTRERSESGRRPKGCNGRSELRRTRERSESGRRPKGCNAGGRRPKRCNGRSEWELEPWLERGPMLRRKWCGEAQSRGGMDRGSAQLIARPGPSATPPARRPR